MQNAELGASILALVQSHLPRALARQTQLTVFGARVSGKHVTSQVQNGPRTCLLNTLLSTPEYLYLSTPASCFLVIRIVTDSTCYEEWPLIGTA